MRCWKWERVGKRRTSLEVVRASTLCLRRGRALGDGHGSLCLLAKIAKRHFGQLRFIVLSVNGEMKQLKSDVRVFLLTMTYPPSASVTFLALSFEKSVLGKQSNLAILDCYVVIGSVLCCHNEAVDDQEVEGVHCELRALNWPCRKSSRKAGSEIEAMTPVEWQ